MKKLFHSRHFAFASHRLGTIIVTFFSVITLQAAIAQTPAPPPKPYQVNIHIWQDNALLSAPKIVAYENELSELIISNPDILKLAMRVSPNHSQSDQKLLISGEVYLAGNGAEPPTKWVKIGNPQITAQEQERTSIELDISNHGLTHKNGRPVETLKLSILVEK